jgi:crossover junction endodeoxyribonuclease RusA
MSDYIKFEVLGRAAPQGSMRGYVVNGKAKLTCDNAHTIPYRQAVGYAALTARDSDAIFAGPHVAVSVQCDFYLKRPKGHLKKWTHPPTKPDIDKLCRATLDALTGILFADDGQVVGLKAVKHYGLPERALISVEKVDG